MNNINPPMILTPILEMKEPNEPIVIHEGDFDLVGKGIKDIRINGIIRFVWFPKIGLEFEGEVINNYNNISSGTGIPKQFNIKVETWNIGRFIPSFLRSSGTPITKWVLSGFSNSLNFIGDISIPVKVVRFEVCNLKFYVGNWVTIPNEEGVDMGGTQRLVFETDQITITLDQHWEHQERRKALRGKGGYLTLCSGELVINKKSVGRDGMYKYLKPFNFFLYFLNGRRVSAMFLQGISPEGETVWKDYSAYGTDAYKLVHNWSHNVDSINDSFNNLWNQFYNLWQKDEDTQEILKSIIHWYIEANNESGRVEGAMIMALAALELLFNWVIVSELKMVSNTDSEKLTTAGKVRLLVNYLGESFDIPLGFRKLVQYATSDHNIKDGPDILVYVRNNIVHSNAKNLKNVAKMEPQMMGEALQLSLFYIELSLLKVLKYKGNFHNRTNGKVEELDYSGQ